LLARRGRQHFGAKRTSFKKASPSGEKGLDTLRESLGPSRSITGHCSCRSGNNIVGPPEPQRDRWNAAPAGRCRPERNSISLLVKRANTRALRHIGTVRGPGASREAAACRAPCDSQDSHHVPACRRSARWDDS
jgi:hypothetical protein